MLELHRVGYAYPGGDWVFRGVSLSVPAGSATAVLGPNGRGKTTLARCAAGLLTPTEGEVGRDAHVGFVPQARGSAFAYSVGEMVLMGRAGRIGTFSLPGRRDHAAAERAMDRVGVAHLADRPFPQLSGGEQQLVLIARAVASGSPVMVLDEPATGLDLRNQGQVLVLVRALVSEGMSVLFTTHHPDHALFVADSVVLMHDRDTVRSGPVEDLLTDGNLSSLYGVPVSSVRAEAGGTRRRTLVVGYEGDTVSDTSPVAPSRQTDPVAGPFPSGLSRRGPARVRSARDHR